MNTRTLLRLFGVLLVMALAASTAVAYIHFPPMTMPKMCKHSTNIRVLSINKHDKEKGVVVYEVLETLKGQNSKNMSFKHVMRQHAEGVQPILDWIGDKKQAVMFTIEGGEIACGYVFIDELCYSVDYNRKGDFWLLIRAEPNLSACYYGSAEKLPKLAKDILSGKEVKVPVKEMAIPDAKAAHEKRFKEVNDVLIKNRGLTENPG